MGILEFLSNLFDHSTAFPLSDSMSQSDFGTNIGSTIDSSSSDWSPTANDAFGVAAGSFQCASESSSVTPSFSASTDTWGSIVP